MRFAGFWIRVVANFIDTVILGLILIFVALLLGPSGFATLREPSSAGLLLSMTVIGGSIFYQSVSVAIWGATPGKLALGLRVVRSNGAQLNFGRSVARAAAFMVDVMVPFSVGFLIAAFDRQKRTLHDYMAGTRVIRKPANSVLF